MLCRGSNLNSISSSNTSANEGHNLGEVETVWKELAASEMRINLMENLQHYKVGFNDVEFFNLGIHYNAKMKTCNDKVDKKKVEEVMKYKKKDEVKYMKKMLREKMKIRKKMEEELGRKNNEYRRLMKHLNEVARKKKAELRDEYSKKVENLRLRHEDNRDKDLDKIPDEMEGF